MRGVGDASIEAEETESTVTNLTGMRETARHAGTGIASIGATLLMAISSDTDITVITRWDEMQIETQTEKVRTTRPQANAARPRQRLHRTPNTSCPALSTPHKPSWGQMARPLVLCPRRARAWGSLSMRGIRIAMSKLSRMLGIAVRGLRRSVLMRF